MELKDFFKYWDNVQTTILNMATLLEEDDLTYTFDPALNPVGDIFYHIGAVYNGFLTHQLKDGEANPHIPKEDLTVENIQEFLKNAFNRFNRFLEKSSLNDWDKIDYDDQDKPYEVSFGWTLCHLVEHSVHHRAQLKLQYKFLNKKLNFSI